MKKIVFLLLSLLPLQTLFAQKVGLVLSGGGAKGLAHIGVIKVLEANNIPIDYITGTSMGAIIGGLYAAGYTTDEMEELFRSDDFYFWSTGIIQKEFRYFFKQPEENPQWIKLKMERREDRLKILPPTNIVPQWQMDFAFMEMMATTNAISGSNFDNLFVPFRCVATEVFTNTAVILGEGDLGEAIRASMTFPFVFRPISINGKLLFDGGIVNNFPTDVMVETFQPDIIIGHKVADDPQFAEDDDIIRQITNMIQRPTNYEIPAELGILIETQLSNVGILDFQKLDYIVEQGAASTYPVIAEMRRRIERRVTQEELMLRREVFNNQKPALLFQNIQLEGVADPLQQRFIINSIRRNKSIFTIDAFKQEYFKLIADEQIKSIRPVAMYNSESGYFDVHLIVEPEKSAEITVGGNVSTKPINLGFVSFDYRMFNNRSYTISSNLYFGRFYSSFKLGGRVDFPSELQFHLASYLTYNRWDYFVSSNELFFEDVAPPFIIQNESNFRNEIGLPLGLHEKLTAGLAWAGSRDEYYQAERFAAGEAVDRTDFNAAVSHIEYERNSHNARQYATEGIYRKVGLRYIVGRERYLPGMSNSQISSRHNHSYLLFNLVSDRYWLARRSFTIGHHIEAAFSNKKFFTNHTVSQLTAPGFNPTPHSKAMYVSNFHANNFIAGGLKGIYHINNSLHTRLEAYAFAPIYEAFRLPDNRTAKSDKIFTGLYWQGMAALVYETGLGPASLTVNYYDKTNTQWYVTLNFGYILFNKRGF